MAHDHFEPLGIGAGSLLGGRYDVLEKIGSGAMSAVYKVIDRSVKNDLIALKLFSPVLTSDPVQLERFRNEVSITRKLTHGHIVRTFDFGCTEQSYYYMTMEYVGGASLAQILRYHGRLDFNDTIRILRQMLIGVGYAHSLGVVHRDLKPANLLIGDKGELKIADFGLAQTQAINMRLTKAGECVGTPFYMSPEQIQGLEVDARADIYSAGIIAYELIAGDVPFRSENWFELASTVVTKELPELTGKAKKTPKWFQDFLKQSTAKMPADRYSSAEEVLELFQKYLPAEENTAIRSVYQPTSLGRRNSVLAATKELPNTFTRRLGLASAIFVSAALVLLVGVIGFASTPKEKIVSATQTLDKTKTSINEFADTLNKLVHAVEGAANNKDAINKFLNEKVEPEKTEKTDGEPTPTPPRQ